VTATTGEDALFSLPARQLAAAIARGSVSAAAAVEAHIARIEEMDPKLNAVVVKRYEAARREARAADERRGRGETPGPLHGVPVTIKECIAVSGTPATFGLESRRDAIDSADDLHVKRLKDAGAIVLAKTNVAQLLLFIESDNPVYGRTNNPWNLARSPGGSSGGEDAIIAAGGSPLGLGTDIGGSCRVPAAFCGIAAIKPTAGRTPDPGRFSMPLGQRAIASQIGVLAREVEDVALGLEVINGGAHAPGEPPMPLGDFRAVDISKLRIGSYADDGIFPPSPAARRAVLEAAEMLRAAGAEVVPWTPPALGEAVDLFVGTFFADRARGMSERVRGQKLDARLVPAFFMARRSRASLAAIEPLLRLFGQNGLADGIRAMGHGDTHHYWRLVERLMDYQAAFLRALDASPSGPLDLLLCPPSPLPALTHGASGYLGLPGSYSCLANVLGYPAGIVPVTRVRAGEEMSRERSLDLVQRTAYVVEKGSAGLPVGVQVIARPWREHVLLATMAVIEAAARRRPDFPRTPVGG
jgi:fatty acid amide hydrolase